MSYADIAAEHGHGFRLGALVGAGLEAAALLLLHQQADRGEFATDEQVRAEFARLLSIPPSVAIAGKVRKGLNERVGELVAHGAR